MRYCSIIGEPSALAEFREGKISFRVFYDSAMRQAELMLAEVSQISARTFGGEDEGT